MRFRISVEGVENGYIVKLNEYCNDEKNWVTTSREELTKVMTEALNLAEKEPPTFEEIAEQFGKQPFFTRS